MLADRDCPATCAFRAVTAYISAAQRIGWDLTTGHLFPVATPEGGRGRLSLTLSLSLRSPYDSEPAKLSEGGRPDEPLHGTLLSLSKSFAGTVVDEIMKNWWLEDRADCEVLLTSGLPPVDRCGVARKRVARVTRTPERATTVARVQKGLCGVCRKELS